jgi:hypothetical protein
VGGHCDCPCCRGMWGRFIASTHTHSIAHEHTHPHSLIIHHCHSSLTPSVQQPVPPYRLDGSGAPCPHCDPALTTPCGDALVAPTHVPTWHSLDTRHTNQSTSTLSVRCNCMFCSIARSTYLSPALCGDTATAGAARHGPRCSLQGPARWQRNTNADLRVSEPR